MTPEQKAAVRHVLERIAHETSQQDLEVIDDWLEDIEEAVRQADEHTEVAEEAERRQYIADHDAHFSATCALCGRQRRDHRNTAFGGPVLNHPFMEV